GTIEPSGSLLKNDKNAFGTPLAWVRPFLAPNQYRGIGMLIHRSKNGIVELTAGGPGDAHGLRTAAVLAAYFQAGQVREFRRVLSERLAVAALVWLLVGMLTSALSPGTVIAGLVLIGTAIVWAIVLEWRAGERL